MKAKYVIGFENGDHCILPDAELVYEATRILHVGRGYSGRVDVEFDAGNSVVAPGFIDLNALSDIDHALFDSWTQPDRRLGLVWSEEYLRDHGPVFTREEEVFRREFALSQLARNGVTTLMPIASESYKEWCEDYEDMADMAHAVTALGLRAYLGPSYRTAVPYTDGKRLLLHVNEARGLGGLDEAVRFARDYEGAAEDLIRTALLPARIETQSEGTLRATREAADALNIPVRLHAAQGLYEVERIWARSGLRPLPYLAEIGFLKPRTFIPHAWAVPGHPHMPKNFGEGDDVALLSDSGTNVLFCPIPMAHYGGCLHTYDSYRQKGVRVVLGTDSAPPNMIRAMDLGMGMTKTFTAERSSASAADLFRSATLDPAEALGRDDLGRLAVGAQADYFVLDLSGPHVGPHLDPIRTMVMNCDGRDITRVVVAGRTVVEDGNVITVDTSDYLERAQDFMERYVASLTISDYAKRPLDELLPSSYPIR
ncbi:chlorohydrolase family protein [Crystallibacter degradans]|uniref:chlorohydrolase family protein n=1 Tax=Crystallibacter degradans TaxID=2726743 RepID=UPI001472727E|nr:amidohydrolase family protein [Arthrobacter sp. SF27]